MSQSYQEILDYLYRQLPMFQRVGPVAFKKDLGNIRLLMEAYGHPHQRFPSIHIAGTNGKGSTAHLLAAVLQAHGLRVGLYTSPHYKDFRERVKINGQLIGEEAVVRFVQEGKSFWESIRPSFFEITVALAFDHFAREKVDVAVIETGLGGRLDSTNVLQPILSIITNIGYDHQEFLGETLPEIAGEKAGIIKAHTPVLIGERHEETTAVFEKKAAKEESPLFWTDQWKANEKKVKGPHTWFDIWVGEELRWSDLKVELTGPFQGANLITSLASLEVLEKELKWIRLQDDLLRSGLAGLKSATYFLGRWEVLGSEPLVIADSAHNKEGLQLVMKQLSRMDYDRLHIVYGTVSDKSIDPILTLLPRKAQYYFAKAAVPRGMDAEQLKEKAGRYGLSGEAYPSVGEALIEARKAAETNDLIYVGGSIFVVAEVL
jgi:dihydrofolate synthase/folylpolyglutamate synthase